MSLMWLTYTRWRPTDSRGRGGCCVARSKTSDTKGTHEGACRILETTNSKHNEKLHCFGIQIYGLQVGDVSKGVIYARLGAKLDGNYIRRPPLSFLVCRPGSGKSKPPASHSLTLSSSASKAKAAPISPLFC